MGKLVLMIVTAVLGTMAGSRPALAQWTPAVSKEQTSVKLQAKATDGKTTLYVGCNKLLGPGVIVTLENYSGSALQRIDDVKGPISFSIRQPDGVREFPAQAHYYAPDKAWVLNQPALTREFALAMAKGDLLTVSNGKGTKFITYQLPEFLITRVFVRSIP